jgi:hypothetical protein
MYAESLELAEQQQSFLSEFNDNPIGAAELVGYLMGRNHRYLRFFIQSFGESLFGHKSICQRIDFLYDLPELKPKTSNAKIMFDEHVECKYRLGKITEQTGLQEILCVSDLYGRHDWISLVLLRQLEMEDNVYSIRTYADDEDSFKHAIETTEYGWNFRPEPSNVDVISIYGRSDGFYDPHKTRSIALLIVWTSNILGFRNK